MPIGFTFTPRLRGVFALAVVAAVASAAQAQTYVWVGTATSNWSTSANWLGGTIPPADGTNTAIVLQTYGNQPGIVATNDVTSNGQFNINSLTFQGSASGAITQVEATGNILNFTGTNAFISQNGAVSFSLGTTNSSTINLGVNVAVGGTGRGALNFNSVLQGSGQLTINYAQPYQAMGTVNFTATNTSWSGGLVLQAGNITMGSASLGTGTLTVTGANTTMTFGGGFGNNIVLNANGTIINGASTITSAISQDATPRGLMILSGGSSGATILQGTNTYSGPTTLTSAPILRFSGATTQYLQVTLGSASSTVQGTLANTSVVNVGDGGTFTIDNTTSALSNRLGSGQAALNVNGTFFLQNANTANTAVSETVGAITVGGAGTQFVGNSVIAVAGGSTANNTGGSTTTLTGASFSRANNAVVTFQGTSRGAGGLGTNLSGLGQTSGVGASQLLLTNATGLTNSLVGGGGALGTTTISIIPWAFGGASPTGSGIEFVTYDATRGVKPLDFSSTNNEYATSITSGNDTNDNVRFYNQASLTVAYAAGTKVNALNLQGTTNLTNVSGTLVLKSGALILNMNTAPTVPSGLTFDFNSREAVVNAVVATTINGTFSNYTAFTKAGGTVLTFGSTATPLLAVPVTLNGGQLSVADITKISPITSLTVNGSMINLGGTGGVGIDYTGSSDATFSAPVTVNGGGVRFRVTTAGTTLTVSGKITGSGGVVLNNGTAAAGNVILSNTGNTYTGQTAISYGTFSVAADSVFGSDSAAAPGGALVIGTGTTLKLTGNFNTYRVVNAIAAFTLDTNGNDATLNNVLVGNVLTKNGLGTLTLTQPTNAFTAGTFIINAGALKVSNGTNGSATGVSAQVSIASGATLTGAGQIGGNGSTAGGVTVAGGGLSPPATPRAPGG